MGASQPCHGKILAASAVTSTPDRHSGCQDIPVARLGGGRAGLEALRLSGDQSAVFAVVWADPAFGPDRGGRGRSGTSTVPWHGWRSSVDQGGDVIRSKADLDVVVGEALVAAALAERADE